MESVKQKCKRVWGRYYRTKRRRRGESSSTVAPEGCFWVEVGEKRERFVMRIELANHPIFKMLLDDTESEYGFSNNDGPIWLPNCDANLFCHALAGMEAEIFDQDRNRRIVSSPNSSLVSSWGCSFQILYPKSCPNSVMHSPLSYRSSNNSCAAEYELLSPYRVYA